MCRWILYKGSMVTIADVIIHPEHSLVRQACRRDVYTPGVEESPLYNSEQHKDRNHIDNIDGFGMAWYTHNKETAFLFRGTQVPWSCCNLHEVAESVETSMFFAHIRAASPGMLVTEANCHPFRMGKYVWMHNGAVGGFTAIKVALIHMLRPDVYHQIQGSTDSEHVFALFVNHFPPQGIHGPFGCKVSSESKKRWHRPEELVKAMRSTILIIRQLQKGAGLTEEHSVFSLNFAVTDGRTVLATRCRTHDQQDPPSLYYAWGTDFHEMGESTWTRRRLDSKDKVGGVRLDSQNNNDTLVIASEPPEYVKVRPDNSLEEIMDNGVFTSPPHYIY